MGAGLACWRANGLACSVAPEGVDEVVEGAEDVLHFALSGGIGDGDAEGADVVAVGAGLLQGLGDGAADGGVHVAEGDLARRALGSTGAFWSCGSGGAVDSDGALGTLGSGRPLGSGWSGGDGGEALELIAQLAGDDERPVHGQRGKRVSVQKIDRYLIPIVFRQHPRIQDTLS